MALPRLGGILQAFLILYLESVIQSVFGEPAPRIEGKVNSVATLQENATKNFSCRVDGWKSAPVLTWYLNGKKQEVNETSVVASSGEMFDQSHSTFAVTAQKTDKELNCSVTDPVTGRVENATVILNVQFKPEVVKMNAHYRESDDPGLFLVLFVLVRANPPANITWVDEDGQVMANTSNFLILDIKSYPWLTNHTVHVQLTSTTKNYSFTAGNDVGITNSSLSFPDFLQSRIEVPVLGIIVGGTLAILTILLLNIVIFWAIHRRRKKTRGGRPEDSLQPPSDFKSMKYDHFRLPRENMSLPSNLQLNDLNKNTKEADAMMKSQPIGPSEDESYSEQDNATTLPNKGFVRFPMVGYIYKVSSMSSDEIWL